MLEIFTKSQIKDNFYVSICSMFLLLQSEWFTLKFCFYVIRNISGCFSFELKLIHKTYLISGVIFRHPCPIRRRYLMNPWAHLLSQALNSSLNKEEGFPGENHNLYVALNLPVHFQHFLSNNN